MIVHCRPFPRLSQPDIPSFAQPCGTVSLGRIYPGWVAVRTIITSLILIFDHSFSDSQHISTAVKQEHQQHLLPFFNSITFYLSTMATRTLFLAPAMLPPSSSPRIRLNLFMLFHFQQKVESLALIKLSGEGSDCGACPDPVIEEGYGLSKLCDIRHQDCP